MSRFVNETKLKFFHVSNITHLRLYLLRTVSTVFLRTIIFTRKNKQWFLPVVLGFVVSVNLLLDMYAGRCPLIFKCFEGDTNKDRVSQTPARGANQ